MHSSGCFLQFVISSSLFYGILIWINLLKLFLDLVDILTWHRSCCSLQFLQMWGALICYKPFCLLSNSYENKLLETRLSCLEFIWFTYLPSIGVVLCNFPKCGERFLISHKLFFLLWNSYENELVEYYLKLGCYY